MNKRLSRRAEEAVNDAIRLGDQLYVPSIAVHELWYGVAKSVRKHSNGRNLLYFLRTPFQILSFDVQDARAAGEIRGKLALHGMPIGPYDILIAGQTLARDLTLITANTREFSRVPGLRLTDWT